MTINRPWTAQDNALLREWKANGASNGAIAAQLGRTENAVRAHLSDLNQNERMREASERAAMGEAASDPRHDPRVPAEVWAERNARMAAPISIGGFVLGDPPVSHSALGRKLGLKMAGGPNET